jgi:DNA-binding GntR family transcriptional regulator
LALSPAASPAVAPAPAVSGLLDRATTAEKVADVLRTQVADGGLRPGAQLVEQELTAAYGVSRGTLREAFQVLLGERLLVRAPHRGVFVRRLDADDVRDIYAARRLVECAALATPVDGAGVHQMREAVADGRRAARTGDWQAVATADVHFHVGVTSCAGSARVDRAVRGLFAELRLAFALVPDPRALHEPFLERNAAVLALAERDRPVEAAAALRGYLDDAEALVLEALAP